MATYESDTQIYQQFRQKLKPIYFFPLSSFYTFKSLFTLIAFQGGEFGGRRGVIGIASEGRD